MHRYDAHSHTEKRMTVMTLAQEQVDTGLAILITMPMIDPMTRHPQDAQLLDLRTYMNSRQSKFTQNPVRPKLHSKNRNEATKAFRD